MKKAAKILSLILALLMMAMVMFACNSDGTGDDDDDDKEKSEEKYANLTPEGVYNKVGQAKNVTVTYAVKSDGYERKETIIKNSDKVKVVEAYASEETGYEREENYYVNLETADVYREEDGQWFYEVDESAKYEIESFINLSMLEDGYGSFFKKENAFESDNYDKSGDVFTFKSDLFADMNEGNRIAVDALTMTRSGSVYTYKITVSSNGESGEMEVTVDFNTTEVKLPENAIEIKYEDYTVTVKDVNGNPIEDVYVNIRSGDDEYEDGDYTSAEGKTVSNLLYGKDYYIVLNHYGYGDVQYIIEEKYYFDGTSANITLYEKEKAVYEVTIKDPDGNPIEGIDVSIYRADNDGYAGYEYTDENGYVKFVFDDPNSYYVQLYGQLDAYKVQEKYYFDGTEPLNIALEEKDSYKVTIKDSNGDPVQDMVVTLYDASGNYICAADVDSEGFAKLIVEGTYNYVYVTIWSYQGEQKYVIEDAYSFSSGSEELNIVLQLKASITIRVLNNAGDAINNVRVFLREVGGYSWEYYYYTNSDGYVIFYDFDESKDYYVTIDNVPYVYTYEDSYDIIGDTLTIYLTPKA